MERQSGETPRELREEPQLPECGTQVYGWFNELAGARSCGFGPNPISFSEIDAWARLTRRHPLPWHIRAIRALDAEILRLIAEEQKEKQRGR